MKGHRGIGLHLFYADQYFTPKYERKMKILFIFFQFLNSDDNKKLEIPSSANCRSSGVTIKYFRHIFLFLFYFLA